MSEDATEQHLLEELLAIEKHEELMKRSLSGDWDGANRFQWHVKLGELVLD